MASGLRTSGNPFTIFAGHTHNYLLSKRNNHKYYILATSGGGSERRGEQFGEFDHITWVTLQDNKEPTVAHINLEGIIDENIVTEEIAKKSAPLNPVAGCSQLHIGIRLIIQLKLLPL